MAQMNLFVLGADGVVRRAVWNSPNWDWSTLAGATFPQGTQISAVSDSKGNIDVFALGTDGAVLWAQSNSGWKWASIAGALFNQGNPVTVLRRSDTQLDFFVLGEDGVVRWAFLDGSTWHWVAITGATFKPGTPIAVGCSPDRHFMSIYVLGQDGEVRWAFQNNAGFHWAPITGGLFNQGNRITTGMTAPGGQELYVLGEDGVVRRIAWNYTTSKWDWFALVDAAFNQGAQVTMAPYAYVFVLGEDGAVRQATYQNGNWPWAAIAGAAFNQGNPVSYLYNENYQLNLFVLGKDGLIRQAFQNNGQNSWPASGWKWAPIDGAAFNQNNTITCLLARSPSAVEPPDDDDVWPWDPTNSAPENNPDIGPGGLGVDPYAPPSGSVDPEPEAPAGNGNNGNGGGGGDAGGAIRRR
jgi:hypothetical protein